MRAQLVGHRPPEQRREPARAVAHDDARDPVFTAIAVSYLFEGDVTNAARYYQRLFDRYVAANRLDTAGETANALGRVPLVLVARRAAPDVYDDLIATFQRAGVNANVQREATQINTALALVMAGVGVALLPRSASRARLDGVTFRPIMQPLFTAFVVAHLKTTSPLVTAFAGVARAVDMDHRQA